jgi:hypothetical protein
VVVDGTTRTAETVAEAPANQASKTKTKLKVWAQTCDVVIPAGAVLKAAAATRYRDKATTSALRAVVLWA